MNTNSNQPEDIAGYNDSTLNELAWAIEASPNKFFLTFAHCNYTSLQQQIVQRLKQLCRIQIRVLHLPESTATLFTAIQEELQGDKPGALMVLGLESVRDLQQVLHSANKVREQFQNQFPFPLILWVNDRVLEALIHWAPDLLNVAQTKKFVATTDMLLSGLQKGTDDLFARLLAANLLESLPRGDTLRWEAHTALLELQSQGYSLEPTLEASLNFAFGREADDQAAKDFQLGQEISAIRHLEEARRYYQPGVEVWQRTGHLERQGLVLFHIGKNYYQQAEYLQRKVEPSEATNSKIRFSLEEARRYFQQCFDSFEQAHRQDLIARLINYLGLVFQQLEAWQELQTLAEKAQVLHQTYQLSSLSAQDYCFLANVSLHQAAYNNAIEQAQKAVDILKTYPLEPDDRRQYQTALLLLAQAQTLSGKLEEAISSLEAAREIGEQTRQIGFDDPKIDLQILGQLHDLYFHQKQYPQAFKVKHQQYSIEQQYGLRAFIGPGRLKSQRTEYSAVGDPGQATTIAQEIIASGRQKDINKLIHQLEEYRFKLIVLYGESGVGKSSMLEAGLVPALKQKTTRGLDFVPILISHYGDWVQELGQHVAEALRGIGIPYKFELDSTAAILEQLRQNEQHHLLTVIIFDQFEELFFIHRNTEEFKCFAEFFCQCLNLGEVKIILSIQGDQIHWLLAFCRMAQQAGIDSAVLANIFNEVLANIFNEENPYYVGNLSADDAKSLINILAQRCQINASEWADALVRDLARNNDGIRPIELQLVGTQLEAERISTLADYLAKGPTEKFVQRYLEGVIKDCGPENERAAELVLYLLTDENNARLLKTKPQLENDLIAITQGLLQEENQSERTNELVEIAKELSQETNKLENVLEILVASGVVALLHGHPINRYQLTHDYLVRIIRHEQGIKLPQLKIELEKAREQRELAEKERDSVLATIQGKNKELEDVNNRLTSQKSRLQFTQKWLISAVALFTLMTIGAGVMAFWARRNQIEVMASEANAFLTADQDLDASVTSLRALQSMQKLKQIVPIFNPQKDLIQTKITQNLQNTFYTDREINRLEGHKASVLSVAFSPDSQLIATASADNTVNLWNRDGSPYQSQGKNHKPLVGHRDRVLAIAFSPDGKHIATASADNTVKLWCRDCDWQCPYTLEGRDGHTAPVQSVSFSPDNQLIATAGDDKTIKLWTRNGQYLKTLVEKPGQKQSHRKPILSVVFSKDSQLIASAGEDKVIKLWRRDGTYIRTLQSPNGYQDAISSVAFDPQGAFIVSGSKDHTIKFWSLDGKLLKTITGYQQPLQNKRLTSNSRLIPNGHQQPITSVSFSPDGQWLATASQDQTVKLWSRDAQLLQTLTGHAGGILQVVFSPNFAQDRTLATASEDTTVKLWKLNPYLLELPSGKVTAVALRADGQRIAVAIEGDYAVHLWGSDGSYMTQLIGHQRTINSISFSPDNQLIATASDDHTVRLWDQNGKAIKTLKGHQGAVNSVSFSPDSQWIVTAGNDRKVILWNRRGQKLKQLPLQEQAESAMFSRDGQTIAAISSSHKLTLWNRAGVVVNPQMSQDLNRLLGQNITLAKVNPLGNILAVVGSEGNTVKLLDIAQRTTIASLKHDKSVKDLSFSPDGQLIATTGMDKTVKLWDLQGNERARFQWKSNDLIESLKFGSDQRIALISSTGKVVLWDWEKGVTEIEKLSCDRINDYLKHGQSVRDSDRNLCQNILPSSTLQKAR